MEMSKKLHKKSIICTVSTVVTQQQTLMKILESAAIIDQTNYTSYDKEIPQSKLIAYQYRWHHKQR